MILTRNCDSGNVSCFFDMTRTQRLGLVKAELVELKHLVSNHQRISFIFFVLQFCTKLFSHVMKFLTCDYGYKPAIFPSLQQRHSRHRDPWKRKPRASLTNSGRPNFQKELLAGDCVTHLENSHLLTRSHHFVLLCIILYQYFMTTLQSPNKCCTAPASQSQQRTLLQTH